MKVKKLFLSITIGILLILFMQICISVYWSYKEIPKTAEEALEVFYSYDGAEDQLKDPLIVAGEKVVPLLIEEVKNKQMPRRRYAITALGNLKNSTAIAVLEQILDDTSEKDYFRCDALNAIAMIDFKRAQDVADKYKSSRLECLLELINILIDRKTWKANNYGERSYLEAFIGRHY